MDIGGSGFHRMDKAAARIHTGAALHAEMPLISLFCLMHFEIPLLLRALGGAGSTAPRICIEHYYSDAEIKQNLDTTIL